jgi:hypothetical protein
LKSIYNDCILQWGHSSSGKCAPQTVTDSNSGLQTPFSRPTSRGALKGPTTIPPNGGGFDQEQLLLTQPPGPHRPYEEQPADASQHSQKQGISVTNISAIAAANVASSSITTTMLALQNLLPPVSMLSPQATSSEAPAPPTPLEASSQQQLHRTRAPDMAVVDTFDMSRTDPELLPPPAANASSSRKLDFVHQQLDSMGRDAEILPGLLLLGGANDERMQGGALQPLRVVMTSCFSAL